MSLDRSLKTSGALDQHCNVLKRADRIAKLIEDGNFEPGKNEPIHLPKVANRKIVTGKKTTKKGPKDEEESAAE